jgi:hypothetical protein
MMPTPYAVAADRLAQGSLPIISFSNLSEQVEVVGGYPSLRELRDSRAYDVMVLPVSRPRLCWLNAKLR